MPQKTVYELITSFHIIISNILMCYIIIMLDRYSSHDKASDIGLIISWIYIGIHIFIIRKVTSKYNPNKDTVFIFQFFSLLLCCISTLLIFSYINPSSEELLFSMSYVIYWIIITVANIIIFILSLFSLIIRKFKESPSLAITIILLMLFFVSLLLLI